MKPWPDPSENPVDTRRPPPGLYIHVPFCREKCDYCAFASAPVHDGEISAWLGGIAHELAVRAPCDFRPVSVFLGGGTPALVGGSALARLWTLLRERIDLSQVTETTIETNPDTLTPDVAETLAGWPGLRISIGVQRFRDDELRLLGRRHSAAVIGDAIGHALRLTPRVGIDLILGIPGCRPVTDELRELLRQHRLEHVSSYFLTLEPGTPLARRVQRGEVGDPDEVGPDELFAVADLLVDSNFEHYEIANFARPNGRCRHNLNTWLGADYLGIGPAAVSTLAGTRSTNAETLAAWLSAKGGPADIEVISPVIAFNEQIMLGLRLVADGLDLVRLQAMTTDLARSHAECRIDALLERAAPYVGRGDLDCDGTRLRLTRRGLVRANTVIGHLMADNDNPRP